jgi:hypothetical protein
LLGCHRPDDPTREQPFVRLALMRLSTRQLVRLAGRDRTYQEFDVVIMLNELPRQFVKQLRVTRRIGRIEIIYWFDEPNPEKVGPDAIDG